MGIKRTASSWQIDLRMHNHSFLSNLQRKMQKTKLPYFHLYFWADRFVNLKSKAATLLIIQSCFFGLLMFGQAKKMGKRSETNNFWIFWNFRTPYSFMVPKSSEIIPSYLWFIKQASHTIDDNYYMNRWYDVSLNSTNATMICARPLVELLCYLQS